MFHKLRFISIIAKIMYIKWNIEIFVCYDQKFYNKRTTLYVS